MWLIVAAKNPQRLSPRGTSGERAGERSIKRSTSSPRPSPASNGGEGEIRKLPTTWNRTSHVVSPAARKREDVRRIHVVFEPTMPWFAACDQRPCRVPG